MKKIVLTIAAVLTLMSCSVEAPKDCNCGEVMYVENDPYTGSYYHIRVNCTNEVVKIKVTVPFINNYGRQYAGDILCNHPKI